MIPYSLLCVENSGFTSCSLFWVDKTWYSNQEKIDLITCIFLISKLKDWLHQISTFVYLQNYFYLVGL